MLIWVHFIVLVNVFLAVNDCIHAMGEQTESGLNQKINQMNPPLLIKLTHPHSFCHSLTLSEILYVSLRDSKCVKMC